VGPGFPFGPIEPCDKEASKLTVEGNIYLFMSQNRNDLWSR